MQTLRKKTSPLKYKNETTRFLGDGVSFKAKLIGILEVSEARGDRMCQEALSDLKMAIRAAGEHKQRIIINIAIDGLRLRDEKTGDSLYHHPVHKISFIAQDMTDSRAFGYIFGSPDTGHRFFGIKTDKAASQVVIAMRDLFQVVFALKKKEIELAKQLLDKNRGYNGSPLYSDSSVSSTKSLTQETTKNTTSEAKANVSTTESKSGGTAVADLVDLELELNSLQQGLNQMERITPSDPFGSKDDPFGDSFISYPPKPILPPPPSSGRERSSRTSDTSSSMFSPKTSSLDSSIDASLLSAKSTKKDFSFSHDFGTSHDEPTSGDWFSTSASIFEEPAPSVPEPTKDEKHEMTKQEILSQFDVFTELDPLGTGRSKPYIDKKHFFQELKNPPKKVLNDLVSKTQEQQNLFGANFSQTIPPKQPIFTTAPSNVSNVFTTDPFGEDPFVKEDPFAQEDFAKQDPFETDFADFKLGNSLKLDQKKSDVLQALYQSNLSGSPKSSVLEKQMSMISSSLKTVQFTKQNTFDSHFDKFGEKVIGKMMELHENASLDMSSESECAPEPPPRPAATLMQIKPPPLPPKKQSNDLSVKPPPRPPHSEDSHYDFIDNYETAPNSLDYFKSIERSPPLPVPARKSKFESDFTTLPERPKKNFSLQSSEEDYLTPISFPEEKPELKSSPQLTSSILLPPPQKSMKKQAQNIAQVTVSSFLESSSNVTTSIAGDSLNTSIEGLDITLSQLTLSGLNELAAKLNIPASQLSNMTLVQLTNYLSNVIKSKSTTPTPNVASEENPEFPAFKADFAANFSDSSTAPSEAYDRYAVFRELMQEDIKQTKIDTEPEQIREEKELANSIDNNVNNLDAKPVKDISSSEDKYAALREIVEIELSRELESDDANRNETDKTIEFQNKDSDDTNKNIENVEYNINLSNNFNKEETEKAIPPKDNIIDYNTQLDNNKKETQETTPIKSPKSPVANKLTPVKSPVPIAVTEIMQNSTRMTSGSLSDVISGSSPEVDNTGSNSEVGKKVADAVAESWAIFDQANLPVESPKEKQPVQSEEGISPWSSDSKEFVNGSPPDWRQRVDSESGGDQWSTRYKKRDQEGWWDTSAEPEAQYYPSNRRSTDSYDEEYYECYDRPRRRRQTNWSGKTAGGHSSSSRDVSPWEEEPRRRELREGRDARICWSRRPRQAPYERRRDRRPTDSWDEEDDYEYEDEQVGRFHWTERHSSRESDRDRHSAGSRDHDSDRWTDEWCEDRRPRRRREMDRDRWCCPDWEQSEQDKPPGRYGSGRWSRPDVPSDKWRDRKHEEKSYRDSQDSPWEDDYSNEPDESHSPHYLTAKRNWKRPSSASEMDRKTGEIKSRHHLGGSDSERDRRFKGTRRSRSRDSHFSEPSHRHRPDSGQSQRMPHRKQQHQYSKPQFESDFSEKPDSSKVDNSNKKTSTLSRKKPKESPMTEEPMHATFPRKSVSKTKSLFENDFVPPEETVSSARTTKFSFESDFELPESESLTVPKHHKAVRHSGIEMRHLPLELRQRGSFKETKVSPRYPVKSKSLFEDDFSPSEKSEQIPEDNGISSIKEEMDVNEEEDSFGGRNTEYATNSRKKILNKNRLSSGMRSDANLKKSESINIFARESDPFDDDFFCGETSDEMQVDSALKKAPPRNVELKWTEDFEDFDIEGK